MARPERNNVDYFPEWIPSKRLSLSLNDLMDRKIAFRRFRSACSSFIKRCEVRDIILKRDKNRCVNCGSTEYLQIDHILSVHKCFSNSLYNFCNSYNNLQVLCMKCNTSKIP